MLLASSSSSSSELSFLSSMGPHSLRSVTSESGISRLYSGGGEFVGHPTASLVVVLDSIPKAVGKIELNRDKRALVVYKVSLLVSFRCEYRCFEVFLGDIAFPPSVQWYSCLEDFFCPGCHCEVRFNVMKQRFAAGLDLSLLIFLA